MARNSRIAARSGSRSRRVFLSRALGDVRESLRHFVDDFHGALVAGSWPRQDPTTGRARTRNRTDRMTMSGVTPLAIGHANGSSLEGNLWAGRIVSTLAVLFLLFDAVIHLMKTPDVAVASLNWTNSLDLAVGIGILEFVCVAIYVIPRTSLIRAILLTGYLGGAMASQLRAGTRSSRRFSRSSLVS
jgi:hypothetical protein